MTEAEWLEADYGTVVEHVRGTASVRKARLFACACSRRAYGVHVRDDGDRCKALLCTEVAERFADGRASREELSRARAAVGRKDLFRLVRAAATPHSERVWSAADDALGPLYNYYGDDRNHADAVAMDEVFTLADIARDIFGNPFRPAAAEPSWLTSDVVGVARGIYEERAFDRTPILADALQDAGCANEDVLSHCRDTSTKHVRGCWVLDLVLGKG